MEVPKLVEDAVALAERLGFPHSSIPEIGRLLHVLVAARPDGRVAEIGTGCGVGAAWIASALGKRGRLVTVELDSGRAGAAAKLFTARPEVVVLNGDWHAALPPEAPFDLLFLDGGHWKQRPFEEAPRALELLAPGGLVVIDDLTPPELWPEEWRGRPDQVRRFWLEHRSLTAVEIRTTPETAAILAVKR